MGAGDAVKLARYNEIVFAVIGTALLLGVTGGVVALLLNLGHHAPGVLVETDTQQTHAPQNLVLCPAVRAPGGRYEYIPVGVVNAANAGSDAVLKRSSISSYDAGFDSCHLQQYGGPARAFNIIVRDTQTGAQRLLLSETAQIAGLAVPDEKCAQGAGATPCGRLLWRWRNKDSNGDGIIDGADQLLAYTSDLAVSRLAPLTPPNASLLNVQWMPTTHKFQVQVQRDGNGDHQYTDEDGTELLEAPDDGSAVAQPFIAPDIERRLHESIQ